MLQSLLLGAALTLGQAQPDPLAPGGGPPTQGTLPPAALPAPPSPGAVLGGPIDVTDPTPGPAALPAADPSPALTPPGILRTTPTSTAALSQPAPGGPEALEIKAPLLPPAKSPTAAEAAKTAPTGAVPDRWWFMREVQGTWVGAMLDQNRMYVTGWTEASFTASTNAVSNQPVVWNDRANRFLLQQEWIRIGRSVVTSGTTDPTFGFQADILIGSDYRFTLPRGLFNSQLQNSTGAQNLYGVDPIQHYLSMYVPTLFRGTEFRAGRLYTPWGVESLEAVSSPLLSKSYAFNWSPPFTHSGFGAYITFNPVWSAVLMAVNGNDVYFGDSSAEWRFVGNVKWTQPGGGRNTATFATSLGSGWFNPSAPFAAATVGLANEPFGRNNFNAFDLVYTHTFNSVLSYNLESIYAYQYNVPGTALPGRDADGFFFTNWFSAAHYLFYTISPRVSAIVRYENFDDFQGQRTGFTGLYTAVTTGMQFKFRKNAIMIRPELRYDYNGQSRPFEGHHDIFTAASDVIIRW